MDFAFTSEQEELRRALRDVAGDRATSAEVRAAVASKDGNDPGLWTLLADELGLAGLVVPEEHGGAGGTFVDAAVVFEESGRWLLPVPLLSAVACAAALVSAAADPECGAAAAKLLPQLATGERVAVLAAAGASGGAGTVTVEGGPADGDATLTGELRHVIDGQLADVFVVAEPDGLWAVAADAVGVAVTPRVGLDPTRRQAAVVLDGAPAQRVGGAGSSARAVDLIRVALGVEAVGVARRCLDLTVGYLKTRVQFDRPIGSFQALQHRAADLVVALESAASTGYYAAWVAAESSLASPGELPVVAPLAKAVCTDAAYRIAAETIQLHGGIGFTWEHDAHLYFKRATAARALLGDAAAQRALVAERSGLVTPHR